MNTETKGPLSELSDSQIFAIILAGLYQHFDHGGYSGRSLQSDAIEFRHLIPHYGHGVEYTGDLRFEILARLKSLQENQNPVLPLTYSVGSLQDYDTHQIIQYTLRNLVWWYANHAKEAGFLDVTCPRIVHVLTKLHIGIHGDLVGDQEIGMNVLKTLIIEIRRRCDVLLEAEIFEYL